MSRLAKQPHGCTDNLVSCYLSGETLRSRRVGEVVLSGRLDVPAPPARLVADWQREITQRLGLEPGDVEALSLPRARMRWPAYRQILQAITLWTQTLGWDDVLATSDQALMACRGARYHHDGTQYGGAAFCNLFLCDTPNLDLHFPALGLHIPLARGTVVIFDTSQPHGVIDRRRDGFDAADFPSGWDCTQVFLTWELPIENVNLAQALGVVFDHEGADPAKPAQPQVWVNGKQASVCPDTGRWM